ncbi:baseplate J/gp47 family protein [Klebsiella pneumoniae]
MKPCARCCFRAPWGRISIRSRVIFDTERLLITEATDEADAVYESDEELRARTLLSWARLSTAGARNAYHYFARGADADVLDVRAYGPETHNQEGRVFSTCCHVPEMGLPRRRCLIKSCQR